MADDDGFREFVRGRLPSLSRVAYLLTGDHHAAEDLVQDTLVKVAGRWSRVNAMERPDAYLRKVMYHQHISAWRRRSRQVGQSTLRPGSLPDKAAAAGDMAEDVTVRVLLEHALAKLTRRQRAVLVLRFFEDLPEATAAEVLGCSVGTVKSQTHHALARLRVLAPDLADCFTEALEAIS
jgi:RNA polymerase sigma-70 factor (sigma-E family)